MKNTDSAESVSSGQKKASFQEGYLPVPIASVPPESLAGLKIFLATPPTYSMYKSTELHFSRKDYDRLIDAQVDYVYISTVDHQAYYNAIESALDGILSNKKIVEERKSEILYSTTLALSNQLLAAPPGVREISKIQKLTGTTVKYIVNNPRAFGHLFNVSNHDFYTATHMANVGTIMVAFATSIGIEESPLLIDLGTGALLHDIGKVFIAQELLNSREVLTPEQIAIIQSHVQRGADHLGGLPGIPGTVMHIVSEHHEKCDGSGYPHRLVRDEISVAGKMASVVDCFEAMISVRPYRSYNFTVEEAIENIRKLVSSSFDETIVASFGQFVEASLLGSNGIRSQANIDGNLQILRQLGIKGLDDNPSGRNYHRYFFRVRSTLYCLDKKEGKWLSGPQERVIANTISQGGIGVLSPRPLALGTTIRLVIHSAKLSPKGDFLATVVRSVDHGNGWHTIGTRFLAPQTDERIQAICQALH